MAASRKKPPAPDPFYSISCDLPFPLYVGRRRYNVAFNGSRFSLKFRLVRQTRLDKRLDIAKTTMDFARDRHGFLSYSHVEMTLPADAVFRFKMTPPGPHKINDLLASSADAASGLARLVLNRFIDWYRQERREFWVEPLQQDEMRRIQTEWVDSAGTRQFIRSFGFPSGGIGPPRVIPKELNNALQRRVRRDEDVPTHQLLLLDAHNALDRGEAHLAIFQAFASVEVAVRQIVRSLITTRRLGLQEAWPLVAHSRRRHAETIDDVMDLDGNVDRMLTRGLADLGFNTPDTDSPHWQGWQRCRQLRNLISHQGFTPSEAHAKRCVRAAERMLDEYLNGYLDSLPRLSTREESLPALEGILGRSKTRRFMNYAKEILTRRPWRLSFRSTKTHPNPEQRTGPIGWETTGERLMIWIDTTLATSAKEALIARTLTFLDFERLGYPRAVVSDDIPWQDERFGYEFAADTLTSAVLHLASEHKVLASGFSVTGLFDLTAERAIDSTLEPGFAMAAASGDLLNIYPLQVARICALSPTHRRTLLASLDAIAPAQSAGARRMLAWLDQIRDWNRETCLRVMVRVHDETMMLHSILVLDPHSGTRYGNGGGASLA